jgi:MinD-like ATPase involved in chromosome partitioning or flagellar assembly
LKNVLEKYKSRYDFIIIDSSPHHSEMLPAIAAADKVFVVTTPDRVTLNTSLKAALSAKRNNLPVYGVLINKIKDSKFELDLEEIQKTTDLPVLARIKDHRKILEANHFKTPITVYDSLNEVSKEIKKFAAALAGHSHKKSFLDKLLKKDFKKEEVNRELMRKTLYTSYFQDMQS